MDDFNNSWQIADKLNPISWTQLELRVLLLHHLAHWIVQGFLELREDSQSPAGELLRLVLSDLGLNFLWTIT